MRIGLFHPNARSIHAMSPEVLARCADPLDIDAQVAMARAAEEVGLDYLFMADAWGRYGPRSTAMGLQDPILLPVILVYTGWSYWVFRGKVRAGHGYY